MAGWRWQSRMQRGPARPRRGEAGFEQLELRQCDDASGDGDAGAAVMKCSGHRFDRSCHGAWPVTWRIVFIMCVVMGHAKSDLPGGINPLLKNALPDRTSQAVQPVHSNPDIIGRSGGKNICGSIDIRNSISMDTSLSDCDVIEGYLHLILISQNRTQATFKNISFPRLKQVTHYVIFYRVQGLQSFSEMFPSLSVIRGYRLFDRYALIVYENHQLRDLGLIALQRIMSGIVRIEKNPFLCYLRTIDWQLITGQTGGVIQFNHESSQDLADAGECPSRNCLNTCNNFTLHGTTRSACWNIKHCQIFPNTNRCHRLCEGGCSKENSPHDCTACKAVEFDGECMDACPSDTYLYEGWRCIGREECIAEQSADGKVNYMAFDGECREKCPSGFTPTETRNSCEKCKGECPKECPGKLVDSPERARSLKGCTIIDGALRIQVSGENIVRELEENLSEVRVIRHYLRVSYSEPLVSLDFLRNLELIKGEKLESKYYALYFLNNHNLVSLWPNSTNFKVEKGRAFFHFNHRLCKDKIDSLLKRLNIAIADEGTIDVGELTNGDKMPCNRLPLWVAVEKLYSTRVVLRWENFSDQVNDYRNVLGYYVYYRQAPQQNIDLFTERNACGGDSWKMVDFSDDLSANNTVLTQMIVKLEPFTQYAFYVETLMADAGPNAKTGQSNVTYFTTLPMRPTVPRNLKVVAIEPRVDASGQNEASLLIKWDPPARPNGIIVQYIVRAHNNPEQLDPNFDFCQDTTAVQSPPKVTTTTRPPLRNVSILSDITDGSECCECTATDGKRRGGAGRAGIDAVQKKDQILFENVLQNAVFVRKTTRAPRSRGRRSINGSAPENSSSPANGSGSPAPCRHYTTSAHGKWCMDYEGFVSANNTKNGTMVTNLRYFAEYTVEVLACQRNMKGLSHNGTLLNSLCSPAAIASQKTKKIAAADQLTQRPTISNQTAGGHVTLTWFDPPDPNGGRVLSYIFHKQRMDSEQAEIPGKVHLCPLEPCEVQPCKRETRQWLPVGNISLWVRARTLAGVGEPSQMVFYVVAAPEGEVSQEAIVGIVVGVLLVLLVAAGVAVFLYRRLEKRQVDAIYTSWNPYYVGQMPYQSDEWEVDVEKVFFDALIGKGSFGSVYDGTALLKSREPGDNTEQLYRVAIKTLQEDANMYDRQAFLTEASVMKEFNCYHVVRLMGIVSNMNTKTVEHIPRPPYVIMELMARGDLKSYLRSVRPEDDNMVPENYPLFTNIYQMAIQIADGMGYLSQMNSVHRDLAARNCMVTEYVTIKIGDFGMTRHLYEKDYYKKGGKGLLPVRWMGPESLRDGRFTSQSDVWSFGVVLWEMATYAAQPYQGLTNEEVINHVLNRNRLSRPNSCSELLYNLMYRCWEYRPTDRPTFVAMIEELLPLVDAEFAKHSFYHTQRPAMLAEAEAASERVEEAEPTVLTPLTAGDAALGRHARMAEAEDLTDEDECDRELLPMAPRRPSQRADPEANYAEFEAMKLEGRNGGHGSLSSSADNSKAHSLQFSSSEGSKGSKASNGSARNGYIASGGGGALSHARTAEC